MADITLAGLTSATTITDGSSNGTGVFDLLMNTTHLYLDDLHTNSKITGTELAGILASSIPAAMQQAVQFILQEQQAGLQADEIAASTIRQDLLASKESALTDEQIIKTQEEVDLLQSQELEIVASTIRQDLLASKESALTDEKIETENKQQILLDTEEEIKQYEHDTLQADTHAQTIAQTALIEQQELTEVKKTAEVAAKTTRDNYVATQQGSLLSSQQGAIQKDLDAKVLQLLVQWDSQYSAAGRDTQTNLGRLDVSDEINALISSISSTTGGV